MFSWLCCNQNVEKRQILEKVLPEKYHYRISTFKVLEESDIVHETKFEAVVAVNICSVDNIEQFLSDFQESSSTNYNILAGDKKGGKKTLKRVTENVTIMFGKEPSQVKIPCAMI